MSVRTRLAMLAALLLPLAASATVVMNLSFEQLTATSQLVVRGKALIPVARQGERGKIETFTDVEISEVLKGKAPSKITIRQPGGVVGKVGQSVDGAAQFKEGEDTLLFLERSPDGSGTYVVLAMAYGKVTFEKTKLGGTLEAFRDARGIATYDPNSGTNEVHPLNSREDLGAADQFLNRIRIAVKATSKGASK